MGLSSNRSLWIKEEVAYTGTSLIIAWVILQFLFENGPKHPPGTNLLISKTTSAYDIYFSPIIIELLYFYLVSVLTVYIYIKV
jgi:hypothetical protein